MPSNVPKLIDYLVSTFQNSATLGQATPPVVVFDGPNPAATETPANVSYPLILYVGLSDPDSDAIEPAATFTQMRDDLGSLTRGEVTTVNMCAEAWSGDDSISNQRHAVAGIVAAVETLVREDNNLGGLGFQQPGVAAGSLLQNNSSTGAIARVPFTITVRSFT